MVNLSANGMLLHQHRTYYRHCSTVRNALRLWIAVAETFDTWTRHDDDDDDGHDAMPVQCCMHQ